MRKVAMVKGENGENTLFVTRRGKTREYNNVTHRSLSRLCDVVNKRRGWRVEVNDIIVYAERDY